MLDLYGISDGINIGHGSLHPVIDQDAPFDPKLQSGFPRKSGIWGHAYGQDHHVGMERSLILQKDLDAPVFFLKALYRMPQRQSDPVSAHFTVDEGGHICVKGIHELLRPLNDRHLHAQFTQILRQFQADEAAACQDRGLRIILMNELFDAEGILHGPQRKHFFRADAGKPWLSGLSPRREEQLVIAFLKDFSAFQIPDRNTFSFRMDRDHLMMNLHCDPEAGEEAFRGLERQLFRILNDPADIIG